jgi:hypothetical protein
MVPGPRVTNRYELDFDARLRLWTCVGTPLRHVSLALQRRQIRSPTHSLSKLT